MVTAFDLSSHNLHLAYLREEQMVVSKRPYGQSFAMSGVLVEVHRDDSIGHPWWPQWLTSWVGSTAVHFNVLWNGYRREGGGVQNSQSVYLQLYTHLQ